MRETSPSAASPSTWWPIWSGIQRWPKKDTRREYGERRLRVLALLGDRLHAAVITYRNEAVHVISFRKANDREVRRYGKER